MGNLTPIQLALLVMMIVWTISAVVVSTGMLVVIVRMTSMLDVIRTVMRVSTAINLDTRSKVDKAEKVAEEVKVTTTRTTEEVLNTVAELRQAVAKPDPAPRWKPGDPDPRARNLGPEYRGKGPMGWLIGPAMVLVGVLGQALAWTTYEDPMRATVTVATATTPSPDRLATAARLMAGREFCAAAEEFGRAADDGSDPEVCLARRAECLFYLGDKDGVLREADRLEGHAPASPWPAYLRGLVSKRGGDLRGAREQFHRAALLGHPQAPAQLRATRG